MMNPTTRRHSIRTRSGVARHGLIALFCVAALAACGSTPKSGDDIASLGTTAAADNSSSDGTTEGTDGTTDSTTAGSVDPQDAPSAYTACMRDEGINLPDPQIVSSDGSANPGGVIAIPAQGGSTGGPETEMPDFDSDEYEAANDVCQPILDDAMGELEIDPEVQAEQREQMLAHAQCMRDQGIDFPDPVFSDDGSVTMTLGGDEEDGGPMLDPQSEELQAAFEACSEYIDGGILVAAAPAGG